MKDYEKEKELKDLLFSYTYIEFEIESINQQILDLSEVINTQRDVKVPELSAVPGAGTISDPVYASVEKIMVTYSQEVAKLETRLEEAFRKRNLIESMLGVLDPTEKKIIELKYFKKYKAWMICSCINYEKTQMYQHHNNAINKMISVFKSGKERT